ncbi:MAG: amino acid permease [Verrucomicrobia bacterium]|nr:amino acid permease [Verrucomicrobiota bacterium]
MSDLNESPTRRISGLTATSIVVANIIGVGIFTSLGFQVGPLPSGFAILMLWLVGGVCALCGALCYAELAAALPRSGGEYHFLGTIYHPALGFMAGWISATAGFAAPVALAAMAFGKYLTGVLPGVSPLLASLAVVWLVTPLLLGDSRLGSGFQNASTLLKVALILGVIVMGCCGGPAQPVSFLPQAGDGARLVSAPFAVSLVYVMFAYSGWNASTYIAGEVRNPARMIPLSVGLGTLLVMGLYLAVNAVFVRSTPLAEMAGKVEVALTAGPYLFGAAGTRIMAGLICLGLVSTISAMMWIGPRVMVVMGEDLRGLRWLAGRNWRGTPRRATLVQFGLVNLFLLTSSFEQVVTGATFVLQLCSFLTVMGVFVLRHRRPDLARPYRTWGYPVTPLVFLAVSAWMLCHLLGSKPTESLVGLGLGVLGLVLYLLSAKNPAASPPAPLNHDPE